MPYPRADSDERVQPKAETTDAGTETVACSSGMAAVSTLLLAHPPPVHVILPEDVYHGVPTLLHTVLQHHGMRFSSIDMRDADKVEQAVREYATQGSDSVGEKGSVVLWMESPSNPLLNVADVSALTSLVERIRGDLVALDSSSSPRMLSTVVDSTLFPPPLSCPLLSGTDFVVHSATKYLGGHSDALLGVVTASPFSDAGRQLASRIRQVQQVTGCQASAFDAWLVLRGMRTLHVRVERQCKAALKVAQFLEKQALVTKVHYPGLSSHPDHLATQTMTKGLYGGVLSFEVADARYAMAVAGAVRVIERGTSLGGTETLIEHRASIEPEDRRVSPPGLLRMSIGLEAAEDLIADLERALHVAEEVVE